MTGAKGPDIDPFPTNEALEAEFERERRETEDLLAAFDRPARGAARSVPSGGPGFVEYYAGDPATRAAERSPREPRPARPAPRQVDLATVVKPQRQRRRASVPPWLFWGGASASMLGLGFVVAVVTTTDPAATRPASQAGATVPAAAPVAAPALRMGRDEVPAPVPTSQSESAEAAPPATAAPATTPLVPPPRPRADGSSAPHRPSGDGTAAPPPPTSRPAEDGPIRRL